VKKSIPPGLGARGGDGEGRGKRSSHHYVCGCVSRYRVRVMTGRGRERMKGRVEHRDCSGEKRLENFQRPFFSEKKGTEEGVGKEREGEMAS